MARIWVLLEVQGTHWLWTGPVDASGMGRTVLPGKVGTRGTVTYVPRALWTLLNGPLAQGRRLQHLCEIARCVRPEYPHWMPAMPARSTRMGPDARRSIPLAAMAQERYATGKYTLAQIGLELGGLTRERVRQLLLIDTGRRG